MTAGKHIFIVAGEASGDAHAGRVIDAIRTRQPDCFIEGVGGESMRRAGVSLLHDHSELSVMGLVEVIRRYPAIKRIFNNVVQHLQRQPPDLLVLVDYPGFNLKLAKKAHKLGIPVLFYISPKVWAWRAGRIKQIKRYVDHMAVLFPFEKTLYRQHDVPVTCVGHPLVDAVKSDLSQSQAREKLGLPINQRVIGLFPGSRRSEVDVLLPIMLAAAKRIHQRHFDFNLVLPLAPGLDPAVIEQHLQHTSLPVYVVRDDFYDVIKSCDAIVAASGTVTLEIALLGVPHLIAYKVSPLSYCILKRLVKIPYVGLCNIVTGKNLVAELIQDDVSAVRLDQKLAALVAHPQSHESAAEVQQQVREALGPSGAADNTARLILELAYAS